jgi:hypothetical protein
VPQDPQASDDAPPTLRISQIIWGALMIAPIMYCVVAYVLRPGDLAVSLPDFSDSFQLGLSIAALAAMVAGFVVPGLFAAGLKRTLSQAGPPDPMRRAAAEQQVMIVRGAFFESVAVFGFVMVPRGAPASQMIPFGVVSLTLLALFFPTRERLAQPFED